jgi:hypothetical protein
MAEIVTLDGQQYMKRNPLGVLSSLTPTSA